MKTTHCLERHQGMRTKTDIILTIALMVLICVCPGCTEGTKDRNDKTVSRIITSDTILSGIVASLLPARGYVVEAILPPGQCPGHYDLKLSDIEKMGKAHITVSFTGMSFMEKARSGRPQIVVDAADRNWMAPDSYIYGLGLLAHELQRQFPQDKEAIQERKERAVREVRSEADLLGEKIKMAGLSGRSVIASSMQREPLEWMGFRVIAEYGRPEAMSTREVVDLARTGRIQKAMLVVDNMQSGPDTGKGIAETLKIPHVVLTNFPSEKGYVATLKENVDSVLRAVKDE